MQKVEIKLIDKTVAKAQQNKMAGRLRNNNVLIQRLKENALNKNTQQSTNTWLKVWKSWASQKGCDEVLKSTNRRLNKFLEDRVLSLPTPSNMLDTSTAS